MIVQPGAEPDLSNRYFAKLTDQGLMQIFIDRTMASNTNRSRANREVRRRAAKAGLPGPLEWLKIHR